MSRCVSCEILSVVSGRCWRQGLMLEHRLPLNPRFQSPRVATPASRVPGGTNTQLVSVVESDAWPPHCEQGCPGEAKRVAAKPGLHEPVELQRGVWDGTDKLVPLGVQPHEVGEVAEFGRNYRPGDPVDRAVAALPKANGNGTQHDRALPHREVAGALRAIRRIGEASPAALCVELIALTGVRRGAARPVGTRSTRMRRGGRFRYHG